MELASRGAGAVAVVVEDEWLVRIEIADALATAGWQVVEVSTGEAALELLDENRPVHLLVTDIRLPGGVTGWDVAEKYRETHRKVIVVYCSGNPVDQRRQVDGSTFMAKPCRMDRLIASLPRPTDA